MIIDLSCPIEMRGYELLHDDTGVTRARIDFFNVSDNTISGYSGIVRWSRDLSGAGANDPIQVDELAIEGGSDFKLALSTTQVPYADRLEFYFTQVHFDNAPDWKPDDSDLVDIGEQRSLKGEELLRLRNVAGEDAVMFPETQDHFWRCVCGRINPLEAEECARCRRERGYVLSELNRKAVGLDEREAYERTRRQARAAASSSRTLHAQKRTSVYISLLLAACVCFIALAVIIAIRM